MLADFGRQVESLGEAAGKFADELHAARSRKETSHGVVMGALKNLYTSAVQHRDDLKQSLKSADDFIATLDKLGEVMTTQHGADLQSYDTLIGQPKDEPDLTQGMTEEELLQGIEGVAGQGKPNAAGNSQDHPI